MENRIGSIPSSPECYPSQKSIFSQPLTAAISDPCDARYITHPLRDLLKQRVFQIASGYEDDNDADTLRADPLFKLAAGRAPTGNR